MNNQEELISTDLNSVDLEGFRFSVNNKKDALCAVIMILSNLSLRVTSITHISNKIDSNPLSINPYLNQLINQRLSAKIYTGSNNVTRSLGMKLFESIIPDEALLKISIEELLQFRQDTKDFYGAWTIIINKLEAQLKKEGHIFTNQDIQNIIDIEINPRLFELKNEIRKVRDERFLSQPPKCLDINSTYFAIQNTGEFNEDKTQMDS